MPEFIRKAALVVIWGAFGLAFVVFLVAIAMPAHSKDIPELAYNTLKPTLLCMGVNVSLSANERRTGKGPKFKEYERRIFKWRDHASNVSEAFSLTEEQFKTAGVKVFRLRHKKYTAEQNRQVSDDCEKRESIILSQIRANLKKHTSAR